MPWKSGDIYVDWKVDAQTHLEHILYQGLPCAFVTSYPVDVSQNEELQSVIPCRPEDQFLSGHKRNAKCLPYPDFSGTFSTQLPS